MHECGSCLGTRRNQPSQTVTEIILQRGEPYVNVRRSFWPSVPIVIQYMFGKIIFLIQTGDFQQNLWRNLYFHR
jgi:hypothetical protein